jgi:hypothetical protein
MGKGQAQAKAKAEPKAQAQPPPDANQAARVDAYLTRARLVLTDDTMDVLSKTANLCLSFISDMNLPAMVARMQPDIVADTSGASARVSRLCFCFFFLNRRSFFSFSHCVSS